MSDHSVLSLTFALPPIAHIIGKRHGLGRSVNIQTGNHHVLGFARNLTHGNIVGPITNGILVPSTWLHASVIWGLQLGNARVDSDGGSHAYAFSGDFRILSQEEKFCSLEVVW